MTDKPEKQEDSFPPETTGQWPDTHYNSNIVGTGAHPPSSVNDQLAPWEESVTNAIGNVIEFWGFKHNHGRVWALLYINERTFCASEIQEKLKLSKGAVSMIVRELERWKVVHRIRVSGSASWHFVAETDLTSMIARVVSERENSLIAMTKNDLAEAEKKLLQDKNVTPGIKKRFKRLNNLVFLAEQATALFLKSAHLDISSIFSIFKGRSSDNPNSKE